MNILFITPIYKPAYVYGGVTIVTSSLAESLVKSGHAVSVYTTNGNGDSDLQVETNEEIILEGVRVTYFKRYSRGHSNVSPGFWRKIFLKAKKFDVVHLHSWWNPTIVIAALMCKLRGVKFVLSPHGMLCDYVLKTNNRRKKQLLHLLIGKYLLKNTFLHVSTQMEWVESQRFYNEKWQGKIIPNLVDLDPSPCKSRKESQPFTIGFLSRIDPKKGLDILIEALSRVGFDYRLKIAGNGSAEYIQFLKQLSVNVGNSGFIEWVGWKNKCQKQDFYASIDLFALTSLNENFAVVIIESLNAGTPVLVSDQVGLSQYVNERQLGWVTKIQDINEVISNLNLISKDWDRLLRIKASSPRIIAADFNKEQLTKKYLDFYKKTMAPSFELSSVHTSYEF